MTEQPIQYGVGGRMTAVLALPDAWAARAPVVVLLNAGLLHRVGPSRLHVRLARELAAAGVPSVRIDLAGKGDSMARAGLGNQESVGADYTEIVQMLDSRFGPTAPRVLAGICSGADNAVRLAIHDARVTGLLLLDPIAFPDRGFVRRRLVAKFTAPARYVAWARRRLGRHRGSAAAGAAQGPVDGLALRDLPTEAQLREALRVVGARGGAVLSVFTGYAEALDYYNAEGQLGRAMGIADYAAYCTEYFWRDVEHTFRLEDHRLRLIDATRQWILATAVRSPSAG